METLVSLEEEGEQTEEFDQRPALHSWQEWIWDGFHELSASRDHSRSIQRQNGMTVFGLPNRIPFGEIEAYSSLQGWEAEKRVAFARCVRALDEVYVRWCDERAVGQTDEPDARIPRLGRGREIGHPPTRSRR